ncbi:MAG: hypothetical protein IT190_10200, partial [Microbacteriaceae bacterium]|nr:hypothetical protein [Microbacteriaceae bacterium]
MATSLQIRAAAELERRKRGGVGVSPFAEYRFEPIRYIIEKLGWHPWAGDAEHPGQVEVLQAYELALRQLHERYDYEQGNLTADQLQYWTPGQAIKNRIRVEAGHTIGKTMAASGIFSHFFDTCAPAIIYSFAPSYEQINDLLWKEIRTARRNANLPGRTLETPELKLSGNHFAKGRATNDSHGRGTERVQGQHGRYLMFIIDEAEGVADFVYDAIESMTSGGIAIVLMLANPRTRTSNFYKQRTRADVANFRISCLYHPNVLVNKEIVPGAVRRDYVEMMIDGHCEIVDQHDADNHTFELPWRPGVIYKPDAEYMFRVLGIAPANLSDNTFVTTGRFEAACQREITEDDASRASIGIDVARYGTDAGTIYVKWNGRIWRAHQITGQNTNVYRERVLSACEWLKGKGVTHLHIRVDGGGGYASGIVDPIQVDMTFQEMFEDIQIIEVHNNGEANDKSSYADKVTEMYGEAAESLKGLTIVNPPPLL